MICLDSNVEFCAIFDKAVELEPRDLLALMYAGEVGQVRLHLRSLPWWALRRRMRAWSRLRGLERTLGAVDTWEDALEVIRRGSRVDEEADR